jgi:hypothetical protein
MADGGSKESWIVNVLGGDGDTFCVANAGNTSVAVEAYNAFGDVVSPFSGVGAVDGGFDPNSPIGGGIARVGGNANGVKPDPIGGRGAAQPS